MHEFAIMLSQLRLEADLKLKWMTRSSHAQLRLGHIDESFKSAKGVPLKRSLAYCLLLDQCAQ